MQVHAYIKYIRVSPKKLRMYRDEVVDLMPAEALGNLSAMQHRSAKILYKAIKSAVDNAVKAHNLTEEGLKFKEIKIDQGPSLKRFRAGSRGIAKPYKRRSSHIFVLLEHNKDTKGKMVKKDPKTQPKQTIEKKGSESISGIDNKQSKEISVTNKSKDK